MAEAKKRAPRKASVKPAPETPEVPRQRETAATTTRPGDTVRVRILSTLATVNGPIKRGAVLEIPAAQAKAWIAGGTAQEA
jgi:DNA replication initiation complex subunit (GINS family)